MLFFFAAEKRATKTAKKVVLILHCHRTCTKKNNKNSFYIFWIFITNILFSSLFFNSFVCNYPILCPFLSLSLLYCFVNTAKTISILPSPPTSLSPLQPSLPFKMVIIKLLYLRPTFFAPWVKRKYRMFIKNCVFKINSSVYMY